MAQSWRGVSLWLTATRSAAPESHGTAESPLRCSLVVCAWRLKSYQPTDLLLLVIRENAPSLLNIEDPPIFYMQSMVLHCSVYTNLFSAFLRSVSHLCPRHSISFATFSLSTDSASSATFPPSFFISSTVGFRSSSSLCKSCQRQTKKESHWVPFHCFILKKKKKPSKFTQQKRSAL